MPSHYYRQNWRVSSACYNEVTPYFYLDPILKGTDIPMFDLTPVYIPVPLFQKVPASIEFFHNQYGPLHDVFNESRVSHFISSVTPLSLHIAEPHRYWRRYWGCSKVV